jgi:outer membrane protein OmpA-like peptidoglycan-associated protein
MQRLRTVLLMFGLAMVGVACQSNPSGDEVASTTEALPTVTELQEPQMVAQTRTEVTQNAPTASTELNTSATQTTTAIVEQTLTELGAQQTSEGIEITLPEDILFDFDQANIRPSAQEALANLNLLLENYAEAPALISGHTDSKGSDQYNQDLSQRRAEAVKTYLVQTFGVNGDRLQTQGLGESDPVVPNTHPDGTDHPENRQQNRRVEVLIQTAQ